MTIYSQDQAGRQHLIWKVLSILGTVILYAGAALTLFGSAMPWTRVQLFGGLHIAVPGFFFALGIVASGCATIAFFARRAPIICLLCGGVVLCACGLANQQIPMSVRKELIGAQLSMSPLNQLLDQFHINEITVANYGEKDEQYIGEGIAVTSNGGGLLILGSLLAIAGDPALNRIRRRILKASCTNCGARWRIARDALFCPQCAEPTRLATYWCRICRGKLEPNDHFCVQCGTEIPSRTG